MPQLKEVKKTYCDDLALNDWLGRIRPFYGGPDHLIRTIRKVGIRNTFEVVQLLEQAKSFVGVVSPSSLSDQLSRSVIKLAREVVARREGEKRRDDYRKRKRFGAHESINDVHIVGEVKSILGMKKKIMEEIGDTPFNTVQVLYGLFVIWKVVEAMRLFEEGRFEEFGISLLIAAKGVYTAKKLDWVNKKATIATTALSRKGRAGGEKSNAEYRSLRAEVFLWLVDHYQEYKEKKELDKAANEIERQNLVPGRSWRKIREDITEYGKLTAQEIRQYINKNRKLRTTCPE